MNEKSHEQTLFKIMERLSKELETYSVGLFSCRRALENGALKEEVYRDRKRKMVLDKLPKHRNNEDELDDSMSAVDEDFLQKWENALVDWKKETKEKNYFISDLQKLIQSLSTMSVILAGGDNDDLRDLEKACIATHTIFSIWVANKILPADIFGFISFAEDLLCLAVSAISFYEGARPVMKRSHRANASKTERKERNEEAVRVLLKSDRYVGKHRLPKSFIDEATKITGQEEKTVRAYLTKIRKEEKSKPH